MNCAICGGLGTVTNGRCAACGAAVDAALSDDEATRIGDDAPPADRGGSTPPAATRVPPEAAGGPADLATMAGGGFDAVTGAGLYPIPEATRLAATTAAGARPGDAQTGPLSPGQPFGPRYQIVRLLGIGGMGAVYQAWDAELGVLVAVKVIRPEVAADPRAAAMLERRFKQELLLARQVTHKNVVRIHELGEIEGIKFITMPFIEGEELAAIIQRGEKLPIERVLKIARGIATGLEAAHAAGVVHRDLKPANIMVDTSDEAMIMDFGIARSTGGPNPRGPAAAGTFRPAALASGQTMAGAVVGTVQYMAPEQARAEAVDQRADIYAFGLIVYDMLLNQQRSRGADTAIAELTSRMESAPPAPRSVDPTIPEPVDRLVTRCVQPDPAERYQTTPDLVAALGRLDETGHLLPVMRRITRPLLAGVAAAFVALIGLTWWLAQGPPPPVQHEPVSVLIADLRNQTGDSTFDGTLEPMLKLALEDAAFISAYDRAGMTRSLGVRPPDSLDEQAALEIAVKQGLGVVLSGSVNRQGDRYAVSVKATQAVTGTVIANETGQARSKDEVLGVATTLATSVREALGDDTSGSAKRFAMETLSATSLEVVREYAAAMEALSRGRFEDALKRFSQAVSLDPGFGLAYAGMAIASRNLDRQQDAEKFVQEAITHLDGMTERERYRTRGLFYYLTSDYQACVKEYGDLIDRYAADAAARNNLALCLTYLRDMPRAMEEMRQVVSILPNRALYRVNLSLYASYSGDFATGVQEAQTAQGESPWAMQALALAQTGQGLVQPAAASYKQLGAQEGLGPSYTASGLGDLAIYEGQYAEAVRILTQGAEADVAAKDSDKAASKFVAVAYAELMRGRRGAAIAAADQALASSQATKIVFLSARVLVEAGAGDRARTLAAGLANELQSAPQAYALIIEGLAALGGGDARQAIRLLSEANGLLDTWIGHFDLGRAYLAAGAFTQADSEFDRCTTRRGEALALFLDEEPTFGYFPLVYFHQGRVREGLKSAGFADSYRAYLEIRGNSNDPLVAEARRLAAPGPPR